MEKYSCNGNASIFISKARIWLYNEGNILSYYLFGHQSRLSKERKALNLNQFGILAAGVYGNRWEEV
jgi:hypothetical protein